MSYREGITINNKHSFNDFGVYIASRNIGIPEKKVIKETIPYMNGSYDFSALAGAPAYEEREITYGFDVMGVTVEEMEEEKAAVLAWLMSVQDADIYDDAYPFTHFHGSYDSASWDEEDSQGHITVVFAVYPFRIENVETVVDFRTAQETKIVTNDGFPVEMKINSPQGATATLAGMSYSVGRGEYTFPVLLPSGDTSIDVVQPDVMTYAQGSRDMNGIKFVVNSTDRYVTANGTATAQAWLYLRLQAANGDLAKGRYRLLGCPKGGDLSTYGISVKIVKADGTETALRDTGSGLIFTVDEDVTSVSMGIFVANGYTASNLAFYPRLYGITEISWRKEVV